MDEREVLRAQLKEMLRKVPEKVNNSGIEFTRQFREFHKKAKKLIETQRATKEQLISAFNQANNYYS
jgi:hypothetical protein